MRQTPLHLAMLTTLAAFTTVVHAGVTAVPSSFSTEVTAAGITFTFNRETFQGTFFDTLNAAGKPVYGTLTSVSLNASLDATDGSTYASDLTLLVWGATAAEPLLQAGGTLGFGTDTGAAELYAWANGDSSAPGTTVVDSFTLARPITFSGSASDPEILLGNGWYDNATWTGSITLNGLSLTPVPEPASWALFAAGAVGLAGWMGRRRRQVTGAR